MPKLTQFRKELVQNIIVVAGKPVPFLPLAGNRGVIELDEEKPADVPIFTALNDYATRRKFGVVKITAEEYEGLKKKVLTLPPSKRRLEKLKVMQPLLKPKSPSPEKVVPAASLPPSKPNILESPKFNQFEADAGVALAREGKPLPEGASESIRHGYSVVDQATKLRTDGPTLEEYTKAGYKAEGYPPTGYAAKPSTATPPAFVPRTAPKPDADKQPAAATK